jgi:hypothetical protein
LETDKKAEEKIINKILMKLHKEFIKKYSRVLKSNKLINSKKFYFFKKEILHLLNSNDLLPYFHTLKLTKTFLQRIEDLLIRI